MQQDRMLWNGNPLNRFATFPTINSVHSNAAELRLQSRHVVRFCMKKRPPMTRRDGASEFPHSNEGCKSTQCGTPRTTPARGLAVTEFKVGSATELKRRGMWGVWAYPQ
jgi:hypothetical protein